LWLPRTVGKHPGVLEAWVLALDHAAPVMGAHGRKLGAEGHDATLAGLGRVPNRTAHVGAADAEDAAFLRSFDVGPRSPVASPQRSPVSTTVVINGTCAG
jgi:hypothetical protein